MIQWVRRILRPLPSPPRRFLSSCFHSIDRARVVEEESLPGYEPEEFYPVHIGEIFQAKYQVLGKIGYGGNSTVWLCRDLQYVSGYSAVLSIW